MAKTIKILCWNCRRAKASSPVWEYFLEQAPDLALLQEVTSISIEVLAQYDVAMYKPINRSGSSQKFNTVIAVKGKLGNPIPLTSNTTWLDNEFRTFTNNIPAREVDVDGLGKLNAISVYSPAWPLPRERWKDNDVDGIKLNQNDDLWVTDILFAGLKTIPDISTGSWVIAGDYNLSETFDAWRGGPRGNREYLDRMASIGLVECLRHWQGELTPTFKNTAGGAVKNQMDHMFVSSEMALRLNTCITGDPEVVFGNNLSDHLPIIAIFFANLSYQNN